MTNLSRDRVTFSPMSADQAEILVSKLSTVVNGRVLSARIDYDHLQRSLAVVFFGGKYGEHSIWLDVSSEARILAHWQGYVEANEKGG